MLPLTSNNSAMLTPASIRRLTPEAYEFLWRTILRRDHGTAYQHVDVYGIDCMTTATAYQIYHHQGAAWEVVQKKLREDLQAAGSARTGRVYTFDEWIFITTFDFKDPKKQTWLSERKAEVLPLRLVTWGDEDLADKLARHLDLARMFGLAPEEKAQAPVPVPTTSQPDPLAPRRYVEQHGILWAVEEWGPDRPFCVGCFTRDRKWVPMSSFEQGSQFYKWHTYKCPHGHPPIVLDWTKPGPMASKRNSEAAARFLRITPGPSK